MTASEAIRSSSGSFSGRASGFHIFDPRTRILSPEGREIGTDWVDHVVDTLGRGVRLDITIRDFDPIVRPDFHQRSWRCLRQSIAAAEASGKPHLLAARAAMHPLRLGRVASLALWPRARGYLTRTMDRLNGLPRKTRTRALTEMPHLGSLLEMKADGKVRFRAAAPDASPDARRGRRPSGSALVASPGPPAGRPTSA